MRNLAFLAIGSLVVGIACASRVEPVPTVPSSVDAAISSATLADDCGSSGSFAICDVGADDCGTCTQSNVQLSLNNKGSTASTIAVVEAHLLDASTGARLDDVDTRNARIWTGSSYSSWDSTLAAGKDAKVTYDMTRIDWTKIGGGDSWKTFSRRYKLEIVLRVDGADRTLVSGELSREPEVVT